MSVAARFWVQKVTKQAVAGGEIQRLVELAPVVRAKGLEGSDGNTDWAKYTPSGVITLNVSPETEAGQWFEDRLGKDVAIIFSDPE